MSSESVFAPTTPEDVGAWLDELGRAPAELDVDALWRTRVAPGVTPGVAPPATARLAPIPLRRRSARVPRRVAPWRAVVIAASVAAVAIGLGMGVFGLAERSEASLLETVQALARETEAVLADDALTVDEATVLEARVEAVAAAAEIALGADAPRPDALRQVLSTLTQIQTRVHNSAVVGDEASAVLIEPVRARLDAVTARVAAAIQTADPVRDTTTPPVTDRTRTRPVDESDPPESIEPAATDEARPIDPATGARDTDATSGGANEPASDIRPADEAAPLDTEPATRLDSATRDSAESAVAPIAEEPIEPDRLADGQSSPTTSDSNAVDVDRVGRVRDGLR